MKKEVLFEGFVYIVENEVIIGMKAPAPESGLAYALKNINKNINEVIK